MASQWYVLSIKPHKERQVCRQLESRDVSFYFPTMRVKPKNPRAAKEKAYFPGYLFVNLDLEVLGDNALRWVPGAHGLVRFGNEPAAVPEQLIRELRKRLAKIEALLESGRNGLKKGDRVRITGGPFAGYEGIFDLHLSGKERAQVLLVFLNDHAQRVKLDMEDIEKVEKKR